MSKGIQYRNRNTDPKRSSSKYWKHHLAGTRTFSSACVLLCIVLPAHVPLPFFRSERLAKFTWRRSMRSSKYSCSRKRQEWLIIPSVCFPVILLGAQGAAGFLAAPLCHATTSNSRCHASTSLRYSGIPGNRCNRDRWLLMRCDSTSYYYCMCFILPLTGRLCRVLNLQLQYNIPGISSNTDVQVLSAVTWVLLIS